MQSASFWKNAILDDFANHCIWHAIIPTTMTSTMTTWAKKKSAILDFFDKPTENRATLLKVHEAIFFCVGCKKNLESKKYVFALRVLIGKQIGSIYPENQRVYVYCIRFVEAALCLACTKNDFDKSSFIIQPEMETHTMDLLDYLGEHFTTYHLTFDLDGPTIWKNIAKEFQKNHAILMKIFGKVEKICGFCNSKDPKPRYRCSGCNYTHYCNMKCAKSNWKKTQG